MNNYVFIYIRFVRSVIKADSLHVHSTKLQYKAVHHFTV